MVFPNPPSVFFSKVNPRRGRFCQNCYGRIIQVCVLGLTQSPECVALENVQLFKNNSLNFFKLPSLVDSIDDINEVVSEFIDFTAACDGKTGTLNISEVGYHVWVTHKGSKTMSCWRCRLHWNNLLNVVNVERARVQRIHLLSGLQQVFRRNVVTPTSLTDFLTYHS